MSRPPRSPSIKSQSTARNPPQSALEAMDGNDDKFEYSEEDLQDSRDYSTRMDEILGDEEEGQEGSDEEMFTYSGLDAPTDKSMDYNTQLHDILGPDNADEVEDRQVEEELSRYDDSDEFENQNQIVKDEGYSIPQELPTISLPETPPRVASPTTQDSLKRPAFLHPTVSRLRSFIPQDRPSPISNASFATQRSTNALGVPSAAASHFSAISRSSSISRLSEHTQKQARDAFRWTTLHTASSLTHPASSLYGRATVLAANGLLCIGTSSSRALVFDFRQQLKHIITPPVTPTPLPGAVTAIALSTDHTFLAVGHAQGHIFLYDLSRPQTPVRSVAPVTLKSVLAGRKEGHLVGTPVTQIGFVGARHTAIVTADSTGLAFYHSLGKVLFVEASDIVRILGRYPDPGEPPLGPATEASLRPDVKGKGKAVSKPVNNTNSTSILTIASLPLATTPHPTDTYQIQALITPTKMIVVGLKPTPKTWLRRHNSSHNPEIKAEPLLAWFPAFAPSDDSNKETSRKLPGKQKAALATPPTLAYTWGKTLHFLRIKEQRIIQRVRDEKKGKVESIEVGTLAFEEMKTIELGIEGDVRALQWLNIQQLLVVTRSAMLVYDVSNGTRLETFELDPTWLQSVGVAAGIPLSSVSHSVKVYKGKAFLLGQAELRVGTLLSWADHILNHVKAGDFLSSINLARDYYTSTAQGSTYGLPLDPRPVVGAKILELMTSSAQFAFSEQRMRDGSGANSDPTLYPGLVDACARACGAMGNMDFLYNELWEDYAEHGIGSIFLDTLQPLVLNGTVPSNVPPVVAQQLVMHCDARGEYTQAEKLIWHIDPDCLDVNHAIGICKRHALYDALIHVYNAGLRDYVSPVIEFLSLIREIQKRRKEEAGSEALATYLEDAVPNAYKVYDYLGSVLSGIAYPSKKRIEDGADQAKADVYAFICFGRSSTWAGKLVLTADDEGGTEPPYPYLRQLLRFDAEALLHSLDLAFEDSYFNIPDQAVSRQVIINILMDMLSPQSSNILPLPESAASFIRIFVARNVPKYIQSIHVSPSALHRVLVALALDPDPDTCEDRQLAAEFLLSIYKPTDERELRAHFKRSGFFRILRSMYCSDKQWVQLTEAYLQDPNVGAHELFTNLNDIIGFAQGQTAAFEEILIIIQDYLATLLQLGLMQTAYLLDSFAPDLHAQAMRLLKAEHLRFKYLRALVQPHLAWDMEDEEAEHPVRLASKALEADLQREYLALMCHEEPEAVLPLLQSDSGAIFALEQIVEICTQHKLFDVIVWAVDRDEGPSTAIKRLDEFEQKQTAELVQWISASDNDPYSDSYSAVNTNSLKALSKMGVQLCEKAKQEEFWFQLLRAQIRTVQNVVSVGSIDTERAQPLINELRLIIQATFSALTSQSSSEQLLFPRLFRRLLDSSQEGVLPTKNTYTEFRLILTGMLETYRSEGDVLGITKRLMEQDLFEVMKEHVLARQRGWKSSVPICAGCHDQLQITTPDSAPKENVVGVSGEGPLMLMASGLMYHQTCAPVSVK